MRPTAAAPAHYDALSTRIATAGSSPDHVADPPALDERMHHARYVTPNEMAADLGVNPKALRAWLRDKRAKGDHRLVDHQPRTAWRLDPGIAWDLTREYAEERLGEPPDDTDGPHAWLNWSAFQAGRPRRTSPTTSTSQVFATWEEHALYSDAAIRGGPVELGPYTLINTIGREEPRVGAAALRVVLRADEHLADPDYTREINDEDVTVYFAGGLEDELAALLALALGRRMRSGGVTRRGYGHGDETGMPVELEHHPPILVAPRGAPVLPRVAAEVHLESARPYLEAYRDLSGEHAVAVARAASEFADALWYADADARLAWLKLVAAVETAAYWWDVQKDRSNVELLRRNRKKVYNAIKGCGDDVVERVAKDIAGIFKPADKFKDFLLEFDPGPPDERAEEGQFDWSNLEDALDWIYEYRSRELHQGLPFPGPLCEAPPAVGGLPLEAFPALAAEGSGGRWTAKHLPLYLHLFVHVAGGAIRRWWMSMPKAARELAV